jgi:hypothetical protein
MIAAQETDNKTMRLRFWRGRAIVVAPNRGAPPMLFQRIAISAVLAAGLAALPVAAAKAQYYGPPCTPFPLTWPFCVVGAVVGTAATVVSAPFRAVAAPPYYYAPPPAPYYPPPPAYPPPAYNPAPYPR